MFTQPLRRMLFCRAYWSYPQSRVLHSLEFLKKLRQNFSRKDLRLLEVTPEVLNSNLLNLSGFLKEETNWMDEVLRAFESFEKYPLGKASFQEFFESLDFLGNPSKKSFRRKLHFSKQKNILCSLWSIQILDSGFSRPVVWSPNRLVTKKSTAIQEVLSSFLAGTIKDSILKPFQTDAPLQSYVLIVEDLLFGTTKLCTDCISTIQIASSELLSECIKPNSKIFRDHCNNH